MEISIDNTATGQMPAAIARAMAARHANESRVRFWRVLIVTSFFIVVLSANLFVGAVVVYGNMRAQASTENPETKTKIARVSRPLLDGTFCRYTVFDNNTSNTLEDRVERCDSQRANKPKIRVRSEFTWGGK